MSIGVHSPVPGRPSFRQRSGDMTCSPVLARSNAMEAYSRITSPCSAAKIVGRINKQVESSDGTRSFDEISKRYSVTLNGATTAYSVIKTADSGTYILIRGDVDSAIPSRERILGDYGRLVATVILPVPYDHEINSAICLDCPHDHLGRGRCAAPIRITPVRPGADAMRTACPYRIDRQSLQSAPVTSSLGAAAPPNLIANHRESRAERQQWQFLVPLAEPSAPRVPRGRLRPPARPAAGRPRARRSPPVHCRPGRLAGSDSSRERVQARAQFEHSREM